MKEHICKTIENCDFVTIVSEDDRKWLWKFSPKNKKTTAHGILYCPYCGKKLKEDKI